MSPRRRAGNPRIPEMYFGEMFWPSIPPKGKFKVSGIVVAPIRMTDWRKLVTDVVDDVRKSGHSIEQLAELLGEEPSKYPDLAQRWNKLQDYAGRDHAEAARWFRKAAEQGDANLQFFLGVIYGEGQGVPQDNAEAARWFRKAAEQGNANGQFALGFMYAKGQGVPQDYAEAVRLYKKAGDQGETKALYNLGNMYRRGQGVPQDYVEAVKWYRKGAEQSDASAQNSIGVMYDRGWGVPQDYITAHMWFNLAATQGHEKAFEHRSIVAKRMTPTQIAKARQLAREWGEAWEDIAPSTPP